MEQDLNKSLTHPNVEHEIHKRIYDLAWNVTVLTARPEKSVIPDKLYDPTVRIIGNGVMGNALAATLKTYIFNE